MDPELKAKWLRALRSGRYKQIRGWLTSRSATTPGQPKATEDSFCCLGVLAKVSREKWETRGGAASAWVPVGSCPYLYRAGDELTPDEAGTLSNMNDDGRSFREIADWIETNL